MHIYIRVSVYSTDKHIRLRFSKIPGNPGVDYFIKYCTYYKIRTEYFTKYHTCYEIRMEYLIKY